MKRVFILGAGASKAGGMPALNDMINYVSDGKVVADFLKTVFAADLNVKEVHLLPRVDDIYSLIDYALLHDHNLGGYKQEDLRSLRHELNLSICRLYARDSEQANFPGAVEIYRHFVQELVFDQDAVITVNWDIALDFVLQEEQGWNIDYGLANVMDKHFPLIKLHGSVNWAWCEDCSQLSMKGYNYAAWQDLRCPCCGEQSLSPLLVGPTVLPRHQDTCLENCWMAALKVLLQADRIFFIGLSLDAIDLGIYEVVKRGILLNTRHPRIFVIGHGLKQSSQAGELLGNVTVQRYIQLFGPEVVFNMCGFQGRLPAESAYISLQDYLKHD